jgi:hypothetical protein
MESVAVTQKSMKDRLEETGENKVGKITKSIKVLKRK